MLRPSSPRGFAVVPTLLIIVAVLAGGWFLASKWQTDSSGDENGPFQIADFANRDFEGSPALALSFTLQMDASQEELRRTDPGIRNAGAARRCPAHRQGRRGKR